MICQARQAAAHGSGFLPGGHGNPGHVTIGQSHMLSDSRPLINSYTKINLLLLAAATSVVCTFLSTSNISLATLTLRVNHDHCSHNQSSKCLSDLRNSATYCCH